MVDELLAFIQNKADVMDDESLSQICCDSFSDEEIVRSKRLLFESVPNSKRVSRRNIGKKSRHIEDIICLLKQTDPELVPTFVARDLQKLPPVTFDHVDVSKLLKDIVLLQSQLKTIQREYVTSKQLLELKTEIETLKQASIVNNHFDLFNMPRGAELRNINVDTYDSGPMALQQSLESTPRQKEVQNTADLSSQTREVTPTQPTRLSVQLKKSSHSTPAHGTSNRTSAVSLSPHSDSQVNKSPTTCKSSVSVNVSDRSASDDRVLTKKTMAEIVKASDRREKKVGVSSWKQVTYKKGKNKVAVNTIGKANVGPEGKFKAAEIKLPIFISNVCKTTSESDIIAYINEHTSEVVTLYKINRKTEKRYNSYKLYVPKSKFDLFLKDEFWPNGISFRRFVHDGYKTKAVLKQTI